MGTEPSKSPVAVSGVRGHPDQLARGRLLDIDLLHVFVTVVLCDGFTSAAHVLHRTQAAVSLQIRRLEEIAQAQLLRRSSRGVELTASGQSLLIYARKILALNEEAMLSLHAQVVAGPVRIGTYHHFAAEILPSILKAFADVYPEVWVEVHVGLANALPARLGPEFDLVVGLEEHASPASILLSRETVSWYTSVEHQPHVRNPLPIAVMPEGSLFRRWAIESISRGGRVWRIAQVCTSAPAIEATVAAGLAVGVFKAGTVSSHKLRALGAVDGFPPLPSVDVTLTSAPGASSLAAQKLGEFIVENARAMKPAP